MYDDACLCCDSDPFGFDLILGAVEGFVDLGKFTRDEDRTTPADHGMVMMFQPFQGKCKNENCYFKLQGNDKFVRVNWSANYNKSTVIRH